MFMHINCASLQYVISYVTFSSTVYYKVNNLITEHELLTFSDTIIINELSLYHW